MESEQASRLDLKPLVWSVRISALLGLSALTLAGEGEIQPPYLILGWVSAVLSLVFDRWRPGIGERVSRWQTLIVMVLVGIFIQDFFVRNATFFVAIAHFLLVFQTYKLLGAKTRQDCVQILLISFFQILSACTLSVDAWHGVIFLLLIPTATASLFWQHVNREQEIHHAALPAAARQNYYRLTLRMCLWTLPVNILLAAGVFIIFPRFSLNAIFPSLGVGQSGYTENVNLAQTGILQMNNSVVLWLSLEPQDRVRWRGYLRGTTLDYFDGQRWSSSGRLSPHSIAADRQGTVQLTLPRRGGDLLRQTITLVNTTGSVLFTSPYAIRVTAPLSALKVSSDATLRWSSGWRKPLRYEVLSQEHAWDFPNPRINYLQLPDLPLKRAQVLSKSLARAKTPLAKAQAIENYLRSHLRYSLELGNAASQNPVEEFLFIRKEGPCGHFASAMAVMLRLQGIPSRLVAGYYRGEWNEPAEQYVLREKDAHAWVEAFIPGRGWMLFDPSPRQAPPPVFERLSVRLYQYWDYLGLKWNRLVIEYDLYAQLRILEETQRTSQKMNTWFAQINQQLFKRGGMKRTHPKPFRDALMIGAGAASILFGILWIGSRKKSGASSHQEILFYERFMRQMARRGFPKRPTETGWEFAERLQKSEMKLSMNPFEITRKYYLVRFSGSKTIP